MLGPLPYKIIGMEAYIYMENIKEAEYNLNDSSLSGNNTISNTSSDEQKSYYTVYVYEIIVTVVLDTQESCSLDFGDETEQMDIDFPIGLSTKSELHEYITSGSYNISCSCEDIVRSVGVTIDSTENDLNYTISDNTFYDGSAVKLDVLLKVKTLYGKWICNIYIDEDIYDTLSIEKEDKDEEEKKKKKKGGKKNEFTSVDTQITLNKPGWYNLGFECILKDFKIYKSQNVLILDTCFTEYIFTLYPRTSIESPFVIFRIDEKITISKQDFVVCNSMELTYNWRLQKMLEGQFKYINSVNITLDLEYLDFLPYSTYGFYKIDLEVSSNDRLVSDTLYIKFSEVLKPLSFLGGDISSKRLMSSINLINEIDEYYMWCYAITKQALNFTVDSLQVKSVGNFTCSKCTNDTFFEIPNEYPAIYLIKVIAVSDFSYKILQKHLQVDNSTLDINISCVFNCNGQLSIRNDWSLAVSISLTPGQNISLASFNWELYRYVDGNYKPVDDWTFWTAGLFTSSITLGSGHLAPATKYRMAIKVVWLDKIAYASYDAITGIPPRGGKCDLTPLEGKALTTLFQVKCDGWFDDGSSLFKRSTSNVNVKNTELKYMILFSSGSHEWVLSYRSEPSSDLLYFGMGDEENGKAKVTVRIYDVYFSFAFVVFEIVMTKPNIANELQDIQDYLFNFLAPENTYQDSYYLHLSKINSVSSFVISMSIKSILQKLGYDARKMVDGHFIDFDAGSGTALTFEDMMYKISNDDTEEKIRIFTPVISLCIEKLVNITDFSTEINILEIMSSINVVIGYYPYVSEIDMKIVLNLSVQLLQSAVSTNNGSIHIFIADIADSGETLISRIMSILNTEQIVQVKEGLSMEKVEIDYEESLSYVDDEIKSMSLQNAMLNDNERSFIITQAFLKANENINIKRDDASKYNSIMNEIHYYLKSIINAMCPTGRESKSKTSTSVCSEKISNTKMKTSGIGCGPLKIQLIGSSGSQFDNESNVMEALSTDENFLTYDENMRSALITSPTLILSSGGDNSEKSFVVEFEGNLKDMTYRKPKFLDGDQSYMFYHRYQYRSSTDYSCIKITQNKKAILGYEVYFRLNSSPNNDTFDFRTAFTKENLTDTNSYQFCVPHGTFQTNGTIYVGLRPFQLPGHQSANIFSKYAFKGFSANCIAWNGTEWINDTCKMVFGSSIKCQCSTKGEVTVANSFFVPPNAIEFSTVFQKFDLANNGLVFSVVVVITCTFILLIAWTCRQDRKNKWMGNIWPLCDNKIDDAHFYLITVFTGLKVDSGTLSNVCFILCGEDNTSITRPLSDGIHKGFPTGSLRKFLMSSSRYLGDLIYLRMWSDCSGHGLDSSWYVNKVEIMDIKTEKMCEGWIATDSYASTIYNISCNRTNDQLMFKSRFVEHIQHSLSDGHLWFSTYVHPCYSTFSRTQRIVCCATILYLTMITNAMFSPFDDRLKVENDIKIGPIRLNLRQIAVSIQSIAITLPSTLFLVTCFKDSNPSGTCICCKNKINTDEENKDENNTVVQVKASFSREKFLPFWFVYIGWIWATLVIFTSGFFVILYSMEWGSTKSEYWLTSFALSNLESFTLIDPGKILLLSLLVAILRSRPKVKQLSYNEYVNILKAIDGHLNRRRQIQFVRKNIFNPMDEEARKIRRRKITSEIWYKSVILNGVIYSLLLVSAGYLAYVNQDTSNYRMKESLEFTFVHPVGSKYKFTNVNTVRLFFDWMENIVFPNLFPTSSILTKKMVSVEKMYISDGVNIKIGPARLRQMRVVKSENCDYSNLKIESCNKGYSFLNELKEPHCLQWVQDLMNSCPHNESIFNLTSKSWKYTPASKVNGVPIIGMWNTYGGGGYMNNFEINNIISKAMMEELIRAKWIDRQTRAVFLEFTLYNANLHLYAYMNFLVEFPESGGAIPYYIISVFRPYSYNNIVTIVCQVVFIFCIVLLLIKVIYNLMKMEMAFFYTFWNVIDFVSLIFCFVTCSVFIIQLKQTNQILEEFRKDPKSFVNFYHIVIWNEIISISLAFLIFFAIIRLSCTLGVSRTMLQISLIINRCVSHLFGVSFLLCIYAAIYAMLGYLIFGSVWSYRSYSSALVSVFLIILGNTNFTELNDIAPILGKIYFFTVIFFMIFMLLKMFESVLGECISIKQNIDMEDYNFTLLVSKYFRMLREIGKKDTKVNKDRIKKKEFV